MHKATLPPSAIGAANWSLRPQFVSYKTLQTFRSLCILGHKCHDLVEDKKLYGLCCDDWECGGSETV